MLSNEKKHLPLLYIKYGDLPGTCQSNIITETDTKNKRHFNIIPSLWEALGVPACLNKEVQIISLS